MAKFTQDVLMEWDKTRKEYSYSMRRICVAAAFPYTLGLGAYIVVSDRLLGLKTVNIYAIQVFSACLLFVTVGLGLNLISYIKHTKEDVK